MSYARNVVPILKNNCYSCHSTGNSVGSVGILLDNYDSLMRFVDTAHVYACYLVGNITHNPDPTYHPMPYMKPKLDTCSINQIIVWINQGALNN